jgi:hypothetical protein
MEYFNNILCISGKELIISEQNPNGFISLALFKKWKRDGVKVVRRACYGQPALVDFSTIPPQYKNTISQALGLPEENAALTPFKNKIITDPKAVTYYSNYQLADGRYLPDQTQKEYVVNASVLNAVDQVLKDGLQARAKLGKRVNGFWQKASVALNNLRVELGHTLPTNEISLKRRYDKYLKEGYKGLISDKFCNENSRKVSDQLENLILSLYAMPNKPFASDVNQLYTRFLTGDIEVADRKTGELFNPANFMQNGEPIEISRATVWNYLNKPHNRIKVDKVRSGAHRYNSTHRPHHHRHAPEFSFSKITMDDRDLPRKCVNGKWVKAYYAYDVSSGCIIGRAYSLNKDEELFLDCMRDMFRLIDREGFGMPLEVEVENHLVNKFFEDLEQMFPFVRVCNPGNSQEKHAEHLNRAKKYQVEKKNHSSIGRWWSKHEAYQTDRDKINDEFVEKMFTYERLVADDIADCIQFNNQPHPKQKKYPGKTRWQVLIENMNPTAPHVSKALVYKCIGEHTVTTLTRNQYVQVQYTKYQIANLTILDKLAPNNYTVDAYYLPDSEGMIGEVFLYQNNRFICKADKIVEYNTSKAEWTENDKASYIKQSEFVSSFDKLVKEGKNKLASPVIIEKSTLTEAISTPVEVIPQTSNDDSIESLLNDHDNQNYEDRAINNL